MSLEAILEANTVALQTHTAVMSALLERLGAGGALAAPASVAATPTARAETQDAEVAQTKVDTTAAQPKPEQAKAEQKADAATITYDQIKPLIIKVNTTKGREAATTLLAEFGVTRGPELKADQYAAFFARANEVLA